MSHHYGNRIFNNEDYIIPGNVLEAIWREIYMPLITDDGTPKMAIKGDRRRDMAQRLEGLINNAYSVGGFRVRR